MNKTSKLNSMKMINLSAIKDRPIQTLSSIGAMVFSGSLMSKIVNWVITHPNPENIDQLLAGAMLVPLSAIFKFGFDMIDGKKDLD